jgi:hypothetical protein
LPDEAFEDGAPSWLGQGVQEHGSVSHD